MNVSSHYSITAEIARQKSLSDSIAQIQTDISSGIKVHVASDDPVAARRIAQIRTTQASQSVYTTNIATATQTVSQVEDNLNSVQTALISAKELMINANTGTASATDRSALATELQSLAATIKSYGSATDSAGTPIYTKSGQPVAVPVGNNVNIQAASSYDAIFGAVTLSDGTSPSIDSILATTIAALQNNDTAGIAAGANNIDAVYNHVASALTDAGGRAQQINAASDRLESAKLDSADERSGLEDTDITSASADLVQKQTLLSAAQTILAQLSKTSLFDKLS